MKNILVLCTGNSCRSQMAEGFLRKYAPEGVSVYSAGIETHGLNPIAVKVMYEVGVDISNHESELLEKYLDAKIDTVLTVCDNAKESCPVFPEQVKVVHHGFKDPAKAVGNEEQVLNSFRKIRDEIDQYAQIFYSKI